MLWQRSYRYEGRMNWLHYPSHGLQSYLVLSTPGLGLIQDISTQTWSEA